MKPPAKDGEVKKKRVCKIDGIQSTLYNPIPEKFGELQIIHSMKDIFKQFEDLQINSFNSKNHTAITNSSWDR